MQEEGAGRVQKFICSYAEILFLFGVRGIINLFFAVPTPTTAWTSLYRTSTKTKIVHLNFRITVTCESMHLDRVSSSEYGKAPLYPYLF